MAAAFQTMTRASRGSGTCTAVAGVFSVHPHKGPFRMFDSVLNKGLKPKSRFGAGTTISVLLHVGAVFAVWWISTAPVDEELPETAVTFYAAPPPPPPPPPPAKKHHVEKKPVKMKPDVIVQPTIIPTEKPPEVEQPPDEPESDNDEGVEGGVEG